MVAYHRCKTRNTERSTTGNETVTFAISRK